MRSLLSVILIAAAVRAADRKPVVLTDEARKLHADCLLIDGHNDLPWELRTAAIRQKTGFLNIDLTREQKSFQTDIPRLRKGGVGCQFWSSWIPNETAKKGTAVKTTLEQIDLIHRMVERYPNDFEFARSVADIERIHKSGRIASLIGIEGGYSIDNSLELLRNYRRLGVAYMTLTHSDNLDWADSATDEPKVKGLTKFGEDVILEMNRIGMMVDISHVSIDTMKATLKVSRAPVIFSHSSARGIADHPRNVPDDVLPLVKANNGVIMVNFYPGFVTIDGARAMNRMFVKSREFRKQFPDDESKYRDAMRAWSKENEYNRGSIHDVVDHIDHLVKHCGIDHVGIGSDFDGIGKVPAQLDDVSYYPYITQELLNRGYKPDDIRKILGANMLRVMRDVEKVAKP